MSEVIPNYSNVPVFKMTTSSTCAAQNRRRKYCMNIEIAPPQVKKKIKPENHFEILSLSLLWNCNTKYFEGF